MPRTSLASCAIGLVDDDLEWPKISVSGGVTIQVPRPERHNARYASRLAGGIAVSERGDALAEDDLRSATRRQPDLWAWWVQVAILGSLTSPAMSNLPRFGWVPKHRSRGVADRLRGGHGARSPGRGSQLPGEIVVFAWIVSWIPVLIEAPTCTDPIRSEYLNSYSVGNFTVVNPSVLA
jgi:hypothetical protein